MAKRNVQFLQIGFGHIRQDLEVDSILGKDGCILGEADPIKPSHHLVIGAHGRVLFPLTKVSFFFCSSPPEVNCVSSLDHLVGAGEQRGRHVEAERLGGLVVDHQLLFHSN